LKPKGGNDLRGKFLQLASAWLLQDAEPTKGTMKKSFKAFILGGAIALAGVLAIGCSKAPAPSEKMHTLETENGESAVDSYQQNPTAQNKADVDTALAELDGEIHELEGHVARKEGQEKAEAQAKLDLLKRQRDELGRDFTKAKFDALMKDVKEALTP
jgi:hypothetical protein